MVIYNGLQPYHHTRAPRIAPAELQFLQWLESLRKDVERSFGILKGCWRILRTGIRLHNTEVADKIWMTCCALHNLLLNVDGLSEGWKNGVPSQWESESGEFDEIDVSASIRKLIDPNGINERAICSYNTSHWGYMDVDDYDDHCEDLEDDTSNSNNRDEHVLLLCNKGPIAINDKSLQRFWEMLVEHFNVLIHNNKIVWPRRLHDKPRFVSA